MEQDAAIGVPIAEWPQSISGISEAAVGTAAGGAWRLIGH
jgi:hypothetical protein